MTVRKIPAFAPGSFFSFSQATQGWLALCVSLLCAMSVYWPGLYGPLLFDDFHNLAPLNAWIQGRTGWYSVVFGNHSGAFGRPVSMATFVANVAVSGSGTFGLKLGNLLIHLANGALVFALFGRLLRLGALTRSGAEDHRWVPWFAATLWLLHPLLASTVLYIVQRMAMLSAMFTLLAMLSYMTGRAALIAGDRQRAITFLLGGMPAATLLATLSKENGILAPVLCAVLELCVFFPRKRSRGSLAFILAMLGVPALGAAVATVLQPDTLFAGYANRSFTLSDRLLTQPRVLWDYIGALLFPGGGRLGLYQDDYLASHALYDPATAFALLGWAATLVAAWCMRAVVPGVCVGLGIFLVGHALESTIFPLLLYFEHRNYLPAIGVIWATTSLLAYAVEQARVRMHHPSLVFNVGAACLVTAFALATAGRASIWSSQDSILADGIRHHPRSRWLRLDLIAAAMGGNPPQVEAARQHAEVLRESGNPSTARLGAVSRLLIDCAAGTDAEPELVRQAFAGRPEPLEADLLRVIESLGDGVATRPCRGLSPGQLADALSAMLDRSRLPASDFGIWRLRYKAASLYMAAGEQDAALQQSQRAYAGGNADPQVAVFIADLLAARGRLDEADRMLGNAAASLSSDDLIGHQVVAQRRRAIREQATTQ